MSTYVLEGERLRKGAKGGDFDKAKLKSVRIKRLL
jgi:hypothetical protein